MVNPSTSSSQSADSPLAAQPTPSQLDNIKAQLDLVLLALESIAGISSEAMLQAASDLKLTEILADRVALWRLRQASPLRKGQGGRKKLDVEEARSLVLISCYLAKQHHEKIRRAVALLEEMTQKKREPYQNAVLGDYLDQFSNAYQDRMEAGDEAPQGELANLALKLLVDLLFYSQANGHRRFWLALIDRSKA